MITLVRLAGAPGAAVDAPHALGADLPGAQDQSKASGTQGLSLSCQGLGYHPPQSGLVYRHHLHSDAARVPLPGRHHGLVQPEADELAAVELGGCRFLRRSTERGAGQIRPTGDIQLRPGLAVHQHRLHQRAARRQGEDPDGRPRPLDRQPDDRTVLAVAEIRMRLPERLRDRLGDPQRDRGMDHYYNEKRPHSSHGLLTPTEAYDPPPQTLKAAA